MAPFGVQNCNVCFCVFFVPRRLPKRPPEGHAHKTFINSDQNWGVVVSSFSCPLRFWLRGSGFLFGAVLAATSVPQGCLGGPFGVLLRAARGAQKWPPYLRDSWFLGLSRALRGVLVASRWRLARFLHSSFGPVPLISSRWACEVAPQALVWVGCLKP